MPSFVSDLDPAPLWRHFDRLLEIPRGSKREDAARSYARDVARARDCESVTDEAGNLLVRVPASPGREEAPVVVLQAHLDMVQEKNADVVHDFAVDPIVPRRDGDWLGATGTTLGADNGIGVAAMLAILEDEELEHGPLELLFTIDEETGLTGASRLGADLLRGRILINLDSEEEGVITIGCAGGGDSRLHLPISRSPVEGGLALRVAVGGLKGGHSGVDIHRQRGNAIRVLGRAIRAAADRVDLRVVTMEGGNARNAIPREATAVLWLADAAREAEGREALQAALTEAARELRRADPGLRGTVEAGGAPTTAWDAASTRRALDLVGALPHGVVAMSLDLPGLVETSVNLAVVRDEGEALFVMMHNRSSVESALRALRRRVRSIGELAGASVEESPAYPAWQPDVDSPLLARMRDAWLETAGEPAEVGAMHAGLECGIIGEKYGGMDMVSFGPQIEFPHSPDERVRIGSVAPFYAALRRAIGGLARDPAA